MQAARFRIPCGFCFSCNSAAMCAKRLYCLSAKVLLTQAIWYRPQPPNISQAENSSEILLISTKVYSYCSHLQVGYSPQLGRYATSQQCVAIVISTSGVRYDSSLDSRFLFLSSLRQAYALSIIVIFPPSFLLLLPCVV